MARVGVWKVGVHGEGGVCEGGSGTVVRSCGL